jgi:valyl-tRNA synthetase
MPAEEMPTQYQHQDVEKRIAQFWDEHKVSKGSVDRSKKPFCVVIPPPNVTGILHMGHMLDNIPQDVMTRWHRMRGFAAVWIPGTDHAGIATQNVVKKQLEKEGIKMRDLGRAEFIKRVWEFKNKHGSIIIDQLKRLGCSCDWDRERFTMDEGLVKAVLTAFVQLFNKGMIYRGTRMVNWCTVCQTALADDEVEHSTHSSHIWHLKYPLVDAHGKATPECIVVATTRPETMLGDTAVAVHPEDARYKALVGKKVLLPLQNRQIPIIADSFVDPKFGTGAVKITPAHDPNDYQAALRHNLALEVVIGDDGTMTAAAGAAYAGLNRTEARKRVVADLEASGALEKIEKHSHAVGECYRCKSILEPKVSEQWFVKMRPLAEKAKQAVLDGRIQIVPESEKRDYFHWMDSIQDWCISRQLWWGHRIPVYYCDSCNHTTAAIEAPNKCEKCNSTSLRQDEDVLDTWFSAQLWPFSTLGWPEKTPELEFWFPNSWLMSGRDILFFWDSRMIMSALELLGDVPFKTLVLHGLVRDAQGRKLSKSLGNSPDPLALFDQYGTDAVRLAIALNYPMGRQDTKLHEEIYKTGQAFVIKLWNATRLLLTNLEHGIGAMDPTKLELPDLEDRWIISRLGEVIQQHDNYLHKNDIVHAIASVKSFFLDDYCDWYLEIIKSSLRAGGNAKKAKLQIALTCQVTILKLLHLYAPFVTEELWQILQREGVISKTQDGNAESLVLSSWPDAARYRYDDAAERQIGTMISIVRAVREVRQSLDISPKTPLAAKLVYVAPDARANFEPVHGVTQLMGALSGVTEHTESTAPKGFVPFKFQGGVGYVEIPSEIDASVSIGKLTARIEKFNKVLQGIERNLANQDFVNNAPPEVVEENRGKAQELKESIAKLDDFRRSLA